jgi:teichuronic acid biosynthesis protein TuaE
MKVPDTMPAGTPHKDLWLQLLALRWPVALASAALVPLALPFPGNPVTLAGFIAFIGGAALVSSLSWLVVFLPVLAAIGPYFLEMDVAGINLFGFRLLIIILAVFSTPLTVRSEWWFNPVARYTVLFMMLWILYGTISLLWTPSQAEGVSQVLTFMFGLGLILALLNLKCYKPERLDMLRFGWVFAFIAVISQATWELVTGERLPSHKSEPWDTYLDSSMIQATMSAPGGFASFLLLTTPFVLWSMAQARGVEKLFYVGLLAATVFFALYGGARNSFAALILELVIFFLVLERRWYVRCAAVACGLVGALLLANVFTQDDFELAEKYQNAAELGLEDGSIGERITLSLNGIWMALETGGRGVGAAGYPATLAGGDVLIPLRFEQRGRLKPAHNSWVQILSEYGILPFTGLMTLFAWIARLGWQARRRAVEGRGTDRGTVARVVLVGLVGYAFYGIQSGGVLMGSGTWMFLGSLSVMAAFLSEARRRVGLPGAAAGRRQSDIYGAPARSLPGPLAAAPSLSTSCFSARKGRSKKQPAEPAPVSSADE